jgi:hypothetical protein
MKALHFAIAYRTNGTQKGPAAAHVRYITRAQDGAAAHVGYVTRTTQHTREDLVATGYGNLPAWAGNDPAAFFAESDRWERVNGRSATQITASLPRTLGRGELIATVETFLQSQLGTSHAYVWGIHETTASDGGTYPHVHIAFSERQDRGQAQTPQQYFSQQVNPKERAFNHRQWPYAARQAWSDTLNVALEASGVPERVSARSFRDQGIAWQTAQYIDRQTLQRNKALLHEREHTHDTPEMNAKRAQEWEARKRALGLTPDMGQDDVVRRIGDASRARRSAPSEPPQRARAVDLEDAQKVTQEKLSQVRALRQAEEHYTKNPGQIRTPAHLAAIAKVLHDEGQDQGRVRRRLRWERDDEQERGRTHARNW